jgi:hypothetical protein
MSKLTVTDAQNIYCMDPMNYYACQNAYLINAKIIDKNNIEVSHKLSFRNYETVINLSDVAEKFNQFKNKPANLGTCDIYAAIYPYYRCNKSVESIREYDDTEYPLVHFYINDSIDNYNKKIITIKQKKLLEDSDAFIFSQWMLNNVKEFNPPIPTNKVSCPSFSPGLSETEFLLNGGIIDNTIIDSLLAGNKFPEGYNRRPQTSTTLASDTTPATTLVSATTPPSSFNKTYNYLIL